MPLGAGGVARPVDGGGVVRVGRPVEEAVREQRAQDLRRALVEHRLRHAAGQRGVHRARRVGHRGEGVEVQAGQQRLARVLGRAVVGQHVALEAPLAPQDLVEHARVLAGVGAVDAVVGAHDRAHVGLLDRGLEVGQVDLAQRALVHARVHGQAAAHQAHAQRSAGRADAHALLVVHRVVLDVADHALGLRAAQPLHAQPRHQVRVLAVGLERAPAERRAHDVHGGSEDHVVALVLDLVSDHGSVVAGQRPVEGGGQADRGGHGRGLARAHAHGPVAVVDGRHPNARHAAVGAGVGALAAGGALQVLAAQQPHLLVTGQRADQQRGALVGRQRGVAPGV